MIWYQAEMSGMHLSETMPKTFFKIFIETLLAQRLFVL